MKFYEKWWDMIEPTKPVNPYENNPYEKTIYGGLPDIPPPPPPSPRPKRFIWISIAGVLLILLFAGGTVAARIAMSAQHQTPQTKVTHVPASTPTFMPTPTPKIPTATPTPTATPAPYNGPTAYGLYTVFTQDPSVSMLPASQGGGPFTIPTRDWIACCGFYPGHGGYSLEDEYSPGYTTTFCIAVFNTANNAGLIANQISNGGKYPVYCNYGYSPRLFAIQVNQCILMYIPSLQYSNIRGYISDMNNYCG
jgi:hypothetical protein